MNNSNTTTNNRTKKGSTMNNSTKCFNSANDHATAIEEKIARIKSVTLDLLAEATATKSVERANWEIPGSLEYIEQQLDNILDGFKE